MQDRIQRQLRENGVTITQPAQHLRRGGVTIGPDTTAPPVHVRRARRGDRPRLRDRAVRHDPA
jgi:bifunctional N-acetylglucosamine-1-phosphate-uridyltransferase/glucosamine-1-phosphate-acetyltransferase GlmU-like protein